MTRDLRKYARQTSTHLWIGFMLLLFLVGDGLIYAIYGKPAALMGLLCLVGGTAPLLLIALIFWGMERIVNRAREE